MVGVEAFQGEATFSDGHVFEHHGMFDPRGPWGVRGMGEMPFVPLAPALVAAVHDATGVWFDELPLTPERVLGGLGVRKMSYL